MVRHGVHAGDEEHHKETDGLPDGHAGNGGQYRIWIAQPDRWIFDPDPTQNRIEDADDRMIDEAPEHANGNHRHHLREEVGYTVELGEPHALRKDKTEKECDT